MENIRFYLNESSYHDEKNTYEYPTVAYTEDSDTVWYMEPYIDEKISKIIITRNVSEHYVGSDTFLCAFPEQDSIDDVIINGESIFVPKSAMTYVTQIDTYGDRETVVPNENSWFDSPQKPFILEFDEPLTSDDMIVFGCIYDWEVPETQFTCMPLFNDYSDWFWYFELVDQNDTTKLRYINAYPGDTNKYCFWVIKNGAINNNTVTTQENFISPTVNIVLGGVPYEVHVTPTEPTVYTVETIISPSATKLPIISTLIMECDTVDLSELDMSKITDMSYAFA